MPNAARAGVFSPPLLFRPDWAISFFGTDSQEGETEGEDPWRYLPYMYFWERRSGVTIFSHSDQQRENKTLVEGYVDARIAKRKIRD